MQSKIIANIPPVDNPSELLKKGFLYFFIILVKGAISTSSLFTSSISVSSKFISSTFPFILSKKSYSYILLFFCFGSKSNNLMSASSLSLYNKMFSGFIFLLTLPYE